MQWLEKYACKEWGEIVMDRPDCTPWSLFEDSSNRNKDGMMVVHGDTKYTYGQMHQKIEEFGNLIEKYRFTMGGIYLPNCVEFISCLMALNVKGKVVIPLSYQLKGESLHERINYSDIEVIITDKKGYEEIERIMDKLDIKAVFILHGHDEVEVLEFQCKPKELQGISRDTFGIFFTGGSTSEPKGVVISNNAACGNALAVAGVLDFNNSDRFLMARPFTQAGPIISDILMCISSGGCIVIINDLYHPGVFFKTIEDYKITTTYLVRTMLAQILGYPKFKDYDLSSLKRLVLGAMIVPESVTRDTLNKLPHVGLYHCYGLSEASVRVSYLYPEEALKYPGSIGRPIKGCGIKIYREDGTEALPGEEGEIYVTSDYMMDGYYKRDENSRQALTPKGLRTKDRGYRNQDGIYYIVGRVDDLIIQGGNNVYPIEIEEIILRNPSVQEAVVLGIDDEKLGQKIVALIRVSPDSGVEPKDIYKWCRANLEDRKIPRELHFVPGIPRNEMGKINKKELKSYYEKIISQKN